MEREEALRQLRASSTFTFVGDKVLVRQAALLQAAKDLRQQAEQAAHAPRDLSINQSYATPVRAA